VGPTVGLDLFAKTSIPSVPERVLEKLLVALLLKKYPTIYGTGMLITVFTLNHNYPVYMLTPYLFKFPFNIILLSAFPSCLFSSGLPTEVL